MLPAISLSLKMPVCCDGEGEAAPSMKGPQEMFAYPRAPLPCVRPATLVFWKVHQKEDSRESSLPVPQQSVKRSQTLSGSPCLCKGLKQPDIERLCLLL